MYALKHAHTTRASQIAWHSLFVCLDYSCQIASLPHQSSVSSLRYFQTPFCLRLNDGVLRTSFTAVFYVAAVWLPEVIVKGDTEPVHLFN